MMRDCNARTSNLDDFAEIDKDIFDQIHVDPEDIFVSDSFDEIATYEFSARRTSEDDRLNKVGKMLMVSGLFATYLFATHTLSLPDLFATYTFATCTRSLPDIFATCTLIWMVENSEYLQ